MTTATDELSEADRALLAFERQWYRHQGAKEQAVRDEFGITAIAYYQRLNALLDRPAALCEYPLLVKRLRRLRESRRASRATTR
jgi:hypothetical protein